ncbi:MAG: diguanylate cyclase [Betaproteobacteria bacterium]|nr:diguanylate cyclase [Betaproteobacteria bacterium]
MRLRKLFLLTTLLLLSLITVMLLHAGLREYNTYRSARTGLAVLQLTHLVMSVAEKAAVEQDPAYGLFSSEAASVAAAQNQLALAREATDSAFDDAFAGLKAQTAQGGRNTPLTAMLQIAATALSRAQTQLRNARIDIDRVAKIPADERRSSAVAAANKRMAGVVDAVQESIAVLSGYAGRIYPDLVDPLAASQMAAQLREQAGRLGTHFNFALNQQVPLKAEDVHEIQTTQGRIEQLLSLIWLRTFVGNLDAWQSAELAEIRQRYVDVSLPLVRTLAAVGAEGKPYGMNAQGFASIYVPEMHSIVRLRDTLFRIANESGNSAYRKIHRNLLLHTLIGLAIILIEIAVFLFIRRRVLRPLIATNNVLVDIARGKLDNEVPSTRRTDEIGDMIHAAAALRATGLEKRHLEEERERRIEDLKEASSVDPLTGLANRRAFFEHATAQLAAASRRQWPVTVIALDIDHFKDINDRHGHAHGDAVLVELARCIKASLRVPDVAARFGGEEFVVVAIERDAAAGLALAERLRKTIASCIFNANGAKFSVTVSAGVVTLPASEIADMQAVLTYADKALYAAKHQGRNRTMVAQPPPPKAPQG